MYTPYQDNCQFDPKLCPSPGRHCSCRAKVGVRGWHCLYQVHFCQIQRPRSQVIPYHRQIFTKHFEYLFCIYCGIIVSLLHCVDTIGHIYFFFTNVLTHPPGWKYGETKATQRKTRYRFQMESKCTKIHRFLWRSGWQIIEQSWWRSVRHSWRYISCRTLKTSKVLLWWKYMQLLCTSIVKNLPIALVIHPWWQNI